MKLKYGKDDIFDCPEGTYRGVLERIAEPKKRINKPCDAQIRLTFRVKTKKGKEHLVARTFCADLSEGSELFASLESWLAEEIDSLLDEKGELELNLLIGRSADLHITHWNDGSHDTPFVLIVGIFPPGTLVRD